MSDSETLYLVLLAIYLSDCLVWLRRDTVAFVAPLMRSWRLRRHNAVFGNVQGSLVLCNPLPPLGAVFVCPVPAAGPGAAAEASTDTEAVQRRLEEYWKVARPLQVSCNLLFLYLLVLAPIATWWHGLESTAGGILLGLVVMLGFTVVQFWVAHRSRFPGLVSERRSQALLMLVAPPGAVRACDTLSKGWLAGFHPLAVALVLLPREAFAAYARRLLLESRYPASGSGPVPLPMDPVCVGLVREAGLDPEQLLQPPQAEIGCRAYCPRCRSQFALAEGRCVDCGDLALVPFTASSPEGSVPSSA